MKTNQEPVLLNIRRAIAECKEDYALADVKRHLFAALAAAQQVGKKRTVRESQAQAFAEQAKKKNDEWMQRLKDGLKIKFPEENNEQE